MKLTKVDVVVSRRPSKASGLVLDVSCFKSSFRTRQVRIGDTSSGWSSEDDAIGAVFTLFDQSLTKNKFSMTSDLMNNHSSGRVSQTSSHSASMWTWQMMSHLPTSQNNLIYQHNLINRLGFQVIVLVGNVVLVHMNFVQYQSIKL